MRDTMIPRPPSWPRLLGCCLVAAACGAIARGQVVINEVVAANSDRLLQRDDPGYPRPGSTTPWYLASFDDALWRSGNGPFGFGSFSNVTMGVNTSLAMQNKTPSLYVRKVFSASSAQAASSNELQLVARYNDGFIAFLNGVEVARRNMGNPGMFAYRDQTAFNTNNPGAAATAIGIGAANTRLVSGNNVLCIQTHNKSLTGGDASSFLCMADLHLAGAPPATLVTNNTSWRYFVGLMEPSGGVVDHGLLGGVPATAAWATLGFNDSAWRSGQGPFGIEGDDPPDYALGSNLYGEMYGVTPSLYTRALFTASAAEAASTEPLRLLLDYDDGVIVYLNGREVARRNVGVTNTITPHDALATTNHDANGDNTNTVSGAEVTLSLGPANTLLAGGNNVLAIQMHNRSATNSDLIVRATLSTTGSGARTLLAPDATARYFVGVAEPLPDDADEDAEVAEDTPDSEGDWIELRNAGAQAVNLTGWSLTDDADQPRKWYFPAGSVIPAGGYLIVMATGFDVGPANGTTYLHTNFKLDAGGEYIGLVDASGATVSQIAPRMPPQSYFHSYARNASGQFEYTATATPGAPNGGTTYSAITGPPGFSHAGGFYDTPLSVQLSSPDPAATIRYTTNGSDPTASGGAAYSAPIPVSTNTVVRARCFKAGEIPSATRTHTYLISQSTARKSLPAIAIASDPTLGLYGPNASGGPADGEGIMAIKGGGYSTNGTWEFRGDTSAFNFPMQKGRSAEKLSSLEFYPTNGTPLRTDFGFRISGSGHARPRYLLTNAPPARFSPSNFTLKPSFNFFFRDEVGDSPQDYPFFPGNPVTKFEDLRLRAGKNDIQNPFIRDELMRRIFIGTGQQGSRGIFATLFLNGTFKGYYNLCEHLREAFMQKHHGGSAAWDVRQVGEFASGDTIHWNSMIAYLRASNFSNTVAYAGAHNYLDVDNFIDYLLVNIFAATWDWPNNNWVAARERTDAGRWRFYMWDAEGGFGPTGRIPALYDIFIGDTNGDGIAELSEAGSKLDIGAEAKTTTSKYIPAIYTLLRVSPEFRLRFADRAQKHFFHGGCLTKASMEGVYFSLRDDINPIMKETVNQYVNQAFYTNWIYSSTRRSVTFTQLTQYGLWFPTIAPEFGQHGGEIATNTWISISNLNAAGTIYYTTNGSDPRAAGGAIAGTAYAGPMQLPASAILRARVLGAGGEWSALQEATFIVPVPVPIFLPPTNANWTTDSNWNSSPAPYPNGAGASVIINAPGSTNRDISIRAPVTVGSIEFNQGATPYVNKIRDRSTGNTLTFQGTSNQAAITVNGTGAGYAEFEVEADVILNSDLRLVVNNIEGSLAYGALRLRANWRGTGGLIKEGYGLASLTGDSKTYTGETTVNQGVLQLTQPATPSGSPAIRVNPGGQLRLVSASTNGEPRLYPFGGDITLNSLGRGGPIPQQSHYGILGALRFDPETDNSWATVTNRIDFAGISDLHVDGSDNTMELAGPLAGDAGFIKTGGGNLLLSADSPGYAAPVIVSNGTLTVDGRIGSDAEVIVGAALSGGGRVGDIWGSGSVSLDKTILAADSIDGPQCAFAFSTNGPPAYGSAAASGNAVLRLLSADPLGQPGTIDFYFDRPALIAGDRFHGGLFVASGVDLADFLDAATVRFFVPSGTGTQVFAGRTYAPYGGPLPITVTTVPETADFGDGPVTGRVFEIRVAGPPILYEEWKLENFPNPADQSNPLVSGPSANPQRDGVANILRYALDIGPGRLATTALPSLGLYAGAPQFEFHFDPGKNDIAYIVESSDDLLDWPRTLFDSRVDPAEGWDGEIITIADDPLGPGEPCEFYRLRIILVTP